MQQDSDFDDRTHALARLAALERLREQMKKGRRRDMLDSIERMIEHETRALRKNNRDSGPRG